MCGFAGGTDPFWGFAVENENADSWALPFFCFSVLSSSGIVLQCLQKRENVSGCPQTLDVEQGNKILF